MSLEINKCPICLKLAVDYRHIELIARFSNIIKFPQCSICYGIPPTHYTPENVRSTDMIKTLIELINYHIERSDKNDSFREIVNWRAITFALQVHLQRFHISSIIPIDGKLGFPIMDKNKVNEILNRINCSKISNLEEVQQEIKTIRLHQKMEQKYISNELNVGDNDKIFYYLLKCGVKIEEKSSPKMDKFQKIEQGDEEKSISRKKQEGDIMKKKICKKKEKGQVKNINKRKKCETNEQEKKQYRTRQNSFVQNYFSELSISDTKKKLQRQQEQCSTSNRRELRQEQKLLNEMQQIGLQMVFRHQKSNKELKVNTLQERRILDADQNRKF